jgi:hypothetical protein
MSELKVFIRFSTPADLWSFKSAINANAVKILSSTLTLVCDCNEEHMELAQNQFNAKEIKRFTPGSHLNNESAYS